MLQYFAELTGAGIAFGATPTPVQKNNDATGDRQQARTKWAVTMRDSP
jgi:hypothetical protein